MAEKTYSLDVAAEILECQQKKLLTEWAKNTINIVMDFGDEIDGPIAHFFINTNTQPSSNEFLNSFPDEFPSYIPYINKPIPLDIKKRNEEIEAEQRRELLRQYGQSGFSIPHFLRRRAKVNHSEAAKGQDVIETDACIFGLWRVSYNDFSRQQVQKNFILTPYPSGDISDEIKAYFTPSHHNAIYALTKKNLRVTESDMSVMRNILIKRPNHRPVQQPVNITTKQLETHGGIERFALQREKILAAALYVAHHFPKEIGKSFKSHAECIDKHSYLFWKGGPEGDTAPDPERVAKILSDATRTPNEWKILGGNAKQKK